MLFDKDNKGRTLQGESMLWLNSSSALTKTKVAQ